jgi:hypothetical protein
MNQRNRFNLKTMAGKDREMRGVRSYTLTICYFKDAVGEFPAEFRILRHLLIRETGENRHCPL